MSYLSKLDPSAVLEGWALLRDLDRLVPVFGLVDEVSGQVVGVARVVLDLNLDLATFRGDPPSDGVDWVSFDNPIVDGFGELAVLLDPFCLVFLVEGLPNVVVHHHQHKDSHELILANPVRVGLFDLACIDLRKPFSQFTVGAHLLSDILKKLFNLGINNSPIPSPKV